MPDLITSSGILSVIAVAILVTAPFLLVPRSEVALGAVSLAVLAATYALEVTDTSISGLNAGPGGAIPLVMFSTLGALAGRLYLQRGVRSTFVVSLVALPLFAVALWHDASWLAYYTSVYEDHGGLALAHWLGMTQGSGTVSLSFWNPSALGALGLVAPVAVTAASLLAFQTRIASHWTMTPWLVLGRHALFVFVAHYALLGLVDLAGLRPPHAGWTLVLLFGLTVACVAMSAGIVAWKRRQRRVS